MAIQRFGDRADYIQLDTPGQNALDFHVAYYLGRLAVEEPDAFFHIISRDKGFDPLIKHLKGKSIFAARSDTIEGMPCFSPPRIVAPAPPKLAPVKTAPPKATKAVKESDVNLVIADLVGRKGVEPACRWGNREIFPFRASGFMPLLLYRSLRLLLADEGDGQLAWHPLRVGVRVRFYLIRTY
ncbi:PIN domain protein [compost metagenome]